LVDLALAVVLPYPDLRIHYIPCISFADFFRSHAGREVDFLVERGKQLVAIEVKWGSSISDSDVANVERCVSDLKGRVHFSAILYGGTKSWPSLRR